MGEGSVSCSGALAMGGDGGGPRVAVSEALPCPQAHLSTSLVTPLNVPCR